MALDMRPLQSSFGVEIAGIDVRRIDDAVFREVARALDDHSVLLFPRQSLTDEEQIAFSERFGPLETTIRTIASQARDLPEISNLSNVDIVGLPVTLKGALADDGHPFSLGYRKSVKDIIADMKTRALTRQGPAVVKDCGGGRTKIVAPNIQFPFYRGYDEYLNTLTMAGAKLTIQTDTPIGEKSKTFTGSFARGKYQDLADTSPILAITSDSDTFQILKSQFTTEYLYRCDGGTVVLNGVTLPQNRPDQAGHDASAVYTNSLFRNLCIGINEGYFTRTAQRQQEVFCRQAVRQWPGQCLCPDHS